MITTEWIDKDTIVTALMEAGVEPTDQWKKALKCLINRRLRNTNPDGRFEDGKRWFPYSTERCQFCESVTKPTRTYPYTYMVHCRTALHVSELHKVDRTLLNRAYRNWKRNEDG